MTPKLLFDVIQASTNSALEYRREVACCWTNEHGPLSVTTQNNPVAVEFGWDDIWPPIRDSGVKPEAVFMMHSHPPGMDSLSQVDRNMVYGWARALGATIYFIISYDLWMLHQSVCAKTEHGGYVIVRGNSFPAHADNAFHCLAHHLVMGLSRLPREVTTDDCAQILALMKMQWETCALLDLVKP